MNLDRDFEILRWQITSNLWNKNAFSKLKISKITVAF